jgi:hypothetical protein
MLHSSAIQVFGIMIMYWVKENISRPGKCGTHAANRKCQ